MTNDLNLFAIAGNPVLHTRSSLMFHAAFNALKMSNYRYLRLCATRAEEIVKIMKEMPVAAFNVTSPFKEDIVYLLDDLDEDARKIGAVNAIVAENGVLKGYNTDVVGVEKALQTRGIGLSGKKAVVLGAGGAARAAVAALNSEGSDVVVVNRTLEKAQSIAGFFSCRADSLENLENELARADILVSCLPGGIDVVPDRCLRKDLIVLDANYGEKAVVAVRSARCGCTVVDGMEWLVSQGVAAFTLFTGHPNPPVEAMRMGASSSVFPTEKSNIALIGFMGGGKSLVGHNLSKLMKLPLVDIDLEIERKHGMSIEDIFEKDGEEAFRTMEVKEIEHATSLSGRIIACGGGAVLSQRVVDCLTKHCVVVWLWAGIETILDRTCDDNTRPLLKTGDRRSRIETMLAFRKSYYAGTSDIVIRTDDKKPEEIAERICHESAQFLKN